MSPHFIFLEIFFFFLKSYCYGLSHCDSSFNKAPRLVSEGQTQICCLCPTSHVPHPCLGWAVPKLGSGTGETGYTVLRLPCCPTGGLTKGSSDLQLLPCEVLAAIAVLVPWDQRGTQKVGWPARAWVLVFSGNANPMGTPCSWRWLRRDHPRCPRSGASWAGEERSGQSHGRK